MFLLEFLETILGEFYTFPFPKLANFSDILNRVVYIEQCLEFWRIIFVGEELYSFMHIIYFIVKTFFVGCPH